PAPRAPAADADATRPGLAVASAAEFKTELVRAVSERTGYPADMLDLDAHMEADLGIDSIKRIEILSGLAARYNLIGDRDEEAVLAELSGYKTLNEIAAWYARTLEPAPQAAADAAGGATAKKAPAPLSPQLEAMEPVVAHADPVLCYVVHACSADDDGEGGDAGAADWPRAFPLLLAGAESPLAAALQHALERLGHVVLRLIPGAATRRLDERRCEADFSSAQHAAAACALLRDPQRPIGALINLMGADTGPAAEAEADAHVGDARALFLMLQAFGADLKAAAAHGAGGLFNLTRLDGRFGLGGQDAPLAPASAGTVGVSKCAALEWPSVRVRCIDAAPGLEPAALAPRLLAEFGRAGAATEIGLSAAGRCAIALRPDGGWRAPPAGPALPPDAVVLVTGGAYGITAEIARALAQRYRPTLVLVGRSALPEAEPAAARDIGDVAALQRFLVGQMRGAGATPAQVDRALKGLLRARSIRANLAAMRSSGARVEYHCLDVRDGAAVEQLVGDLYRRHGRIDGVVHGAGVIGDKLIADKTPASFDAVYDTKVLPALALARTLRPQGLKFVAFFSSVAGRFGNAGQCDYSAANEVLNKLAGGLALRWPQARVLAINWGPWDAGMVDPGLRQLYARRGIRPIPVAEGVRHFLEEIERAAGGAPELVITASMRQIAGAVAQPVHSF
uniref:SDR family NAD(P)-dependent oxidoreductase n=1 Tax=Rugamonas sp. TaxID=1926287 RepID=UPI0026012DF6